MSIYGVLTKAKNGVVYRSKFEAKFVDKFLIPSGMPFEYEKQYPNSKRKCDFYIKNLDIWIECVYHKFTMEYKYKLKNGRIYLNVPYEDREYVKKSKGRWDPAASKWYVVYTGQSVVSLHKYIPANELETIYVSDGNALNATYDERLLEKMLANKIDILVVNHEDMLYDNLLHLIVAKKNEFINRKIIANYFKMYDDLKVIQDRLTEVENELKQHKSNSNNTPASQE